MRIAIALATGLALTACAGGQRAQQLDRIERTLARAPFAAQPSKVVAVEIAFARAAREEGQWTAFRETAAPGAVIHGRNGPVDANSWLSGRPDPAEPIQWGPRAIWMSCDGRLAVSQGRSLTPEGLVGTFVTVWQQQNAGEYKWVYDVGAVDEVQPEPREPEEDLPEDTIVVTAIDSVQGLVADCPRRTGAGMPPAPVPDIATGVRSGLSRSADGTLQWRWEHRSDGTRRVVVDFLTGGRWEEGLDTSFPPDPVG